MRLNLFKGQFVAHPKSLIIMLFFLLGLGVECGAQGNGRDYSGSPNPSSGNQSLTHHFGPYELRNLGGDFTCTIHTDSAVYKIEEVYPGILVHERKPEGKEPSVSQNITLIEYYDVSTKKLLKRINLEEITPYNDRAYATIGVGGLDYEYMDISAPDANCKWPDLPAPSYSLTRNQILSVLSDGFILVSFELLKLAKPFIVVGWEQTVIILDTRGSEVRRIKLEHTIASPILINDNTYLVSSYGGSINRISNPFEPCKASLEIYDLKDGKMVFQYNGETSTEPAETKEEDGLVYTRFFNPQTSQSEQIIVDVKNKEIRTYKFTWGKPLFPKWKEYKRFLESLPSQTIKF